MLVQVSGRGDHIIARKDQGPCGSLISFRDKNKDRGGSWSLVQGMGSKVWLQNGARPGQAMHC